VVYLILVHIKVSVLNLS